MADTDSVFVAGLKDKKQAEQLEAFINKKYDEYAEQQGLKEHRLRIEFENFATRTIMVTKKRYAMLLDDGSYKIAGFQMKRSDAPELAKEMQQEVIEHILNGKGVKDGWKYYDNMKRQILAGELNDRIGLPRKFTKPLDEYQNNYGVEGAKYSNKHLGTNFGKYDKCIIYHVKHPDTTAIAVEAGEPIPKGYQVDTQKHWTRINKAVDKLLHDFLPKDKQMTLEDLL